ncbi:sulfatase [Paenibacillus sp. J31TS4]|uniref:LTA synthase family protein n=1 Tax=Paenibacillus sp. J31TS4 TaxID=2807195 RepID=UPI001B090A27|nr:LTA synthase family protein [Paenibacillus sp. J31TS4]GIP37687.1 sulfatase [Paenibacillus sp. J31TS4]
MLANLTRRAARLLGPTRIYAGWAVLAFWLVVLTELLSRSSWTETAAWSVQRLPALLVNTLLVYSLLLLLAAVLGRLRPAYWALSLLLAALSLISGIKLKMLGVPLLPWDFVLTGETKELLPYIRNIFSLHTVSALLLFLAGSFALLSRAPYRPSRLGMRTRAVLLAVSGVAILGLYSGQPTGLRTALHLQPLSDNQASHVRTNGLAFATLLNTHVLIDGPGAAVDPGRISALLEDAARPAAAAAADRPRPNIVVVLSESFWDPTLLPSVRFSQDPIPFFHSLLASGTGGWMLSPQFGGGTANVEFEVLTGHSMRFLPQGSIAYNQYIGRGVDSLASILHRQGYSTAAISPFHNWYFNSRKVYEYLGFSKFISMEFFKPVYEGPYLADREVANLIIGETAKTPGPDFVFANTMENHFHYFPGKFEKNSFKAEGPITASSRGQLETYAEGAAAADRMLRQLVDYYSALDEPTIVVFFGDHLPFLGDDYAVYRDAGYLAKNDSDELNKMFRVPVVVWNNYLHSPKEELNFSPSFLGPYVLKLAGLPGSSYTDFLGRLAAKVPVIPPKDYYESMGIAENELKDYEALQNDSLFGSQIAMGDLKDRIMDPNYTLGFGPLSIEKAERASADSGSEGTVLRVEGTNLPPLGVVFVNGKPQDTKWENERAVLVTLSKEVAKSPSWEVQIRLADSKETVIAESNVWTARPAMVQ